MPAEPSHDQEAREIEVRDLNDDPWFLLDEIDRPEKRWPVAVEVVAEYVVWVHAESHDEAVRVAKDDGDLHEDFAHARAIDGWWTVQDRRPDQREIEEDTTARYGPWPWCSDCEAMIVYYSRDEHRSLMCRARKAS